MNETRAQWVEFALAEFMTCTGQEECDGWQEVVGDFIADLMHFCKQRGIDFEVVLTNGRFHFEAEARGEE